MLVQLTATGYIINPCDTYTVLWSQLSGPTIVTLSDPTSLTPTFTTSTQGTYVFQVTGTDSNGNIATATTTVTLNND